MTIHEMLRPQSRPDRKGYWIRFPRPGGGDPVRIDLGTNQEEAELVAHDIATIVTLRHTWDDRDHQDLDGLHPKALDSFFGLWDRACDDLRDKTEELRFELVRQRLEQVGLQIEKLWIVSSERRDLIRRGEITEDFGFLSQQKGQNTERKEAGSVAPREMLCRFNCPDGTVIYVRGERDCQDVREQLDRLFGHQNVTTTTMEMNDIPKRFRPEAGVLAGAANGEFGRCVTPAKRWKCVYRIACRDGSVHFAEGALAYDALYRLLRAHAKLGECRITVELVDQVSAATVRELRDLFPAPGEPGYRIPFPERPPKRKRHLCPHCGSREVQIVRGIKGGYERECRDCKKHFQTMNKPITAQ